MTIDHTVVLAGEGLYSVTKRIINDNTYWGKITQTQKDGYATKLASANGMKSLTTGILPGRILHFVKEDFVVPVVTPPQPPVRQVRPVPFTPTSPWNTPISASEQSKWFSVPVLNTVTINGVTQQRNWYAGEGQLTIWRGKATDPVWTVTLPEFGNTDTRFNRHWMPATFTIHAPQNISQATNDDHILAIIDETNGDYLDCWSGVTIDSVAHTITGVAGTGWARGNVDTGTGVGGLLANGGNSAGVRAANFTWIAGAITGYDIDQVLTDKKTDFGHALVVMLGDETLSTWGVTTPATAPNNAWNNGPIRMGSRIGIPANTPRPAKITDKLGIAYFNTLQKYGAYVGDYAGGPWPIFQVDLGSVTTGALDSVWVWWNNPSAPVDPADGLPQSAGRYITPLLKVMEGTNLV
jgi:hypothetical protein